MKILCLCHGGNVRSATLAWLLKDRGHDAIPLGLWRAGADTLAMLSTWADIITVAEAPMHLEVPGEYRGKVVDWGIVGPDVWRRPMHTSLLSMYQTAIPKALDRAAKKEPA